MTLFSFHLTFLQPCLSVPSNIDPSTLNSTFSSTLDVALWPVLSKPSCHISSSPWLSDILYCDRTKLQKVKTNSPKVLHTLLWSFPDNWKHLGFNTFNIFNPFYTFSFHLYSSPPSKLNEYYMTHFKNKVAICSSFSFRTDTTHHLVSLTTSTADLNWNGVQWQHAPARAQLCALLIPSHISNVALDHKSHTMVKAFWGYK